MPISGAFLVLAFRDGDPAAVWRALVAARSGYVALAAALFLAGFLLMALRWRLLLQPIAPVGLGRALSLLMIGYMVNYLVPGRLGEVTRSYLLGTFAGASRTAALATVLVEKVVDGLVLLACLGLLLRLVPLPTGAEAMGIYGSIVFLGVGGALVAARLCQPEVRWLSRRSLGRIPRIGRRAVGLVDAFGAGLATIELSRRAALVVILSVAIWGQATLAMYALMLGLGIELTPYAALVLIVALALGSMIPSAPGFIGTYQFVTVNVLAGFEVSRNDALALSVLVHATEYLLVLGAGLLALAAERMSFYRLFAVARE